MDLSRDYAGQDGGQVRREFRHGLTQIYTVLVLSRRTLRVSIRRGSAVVKTSVFVPHGFIKGLRRTRWRDKFRGFFEKRRKMRRPQRKIAKKRRPKKIKRPKMTSKSSNGQTNGSVFSVRGVYFLQARSIQSIGSSLVLPISCRLCLWAAAQLRIYVQAPGFDGDSVGR